MNPIERELQKETANKTDNPHQPDGIEVKFSTVEELKNGVWDATVSVIRDGKIASGISIHCTKGLEFSKELVDNHTALAGAAMVKFESENGRKLEGSKEDMKAFIRDVCEIVISGAYQLCLRAHNSEPLPQQAKPLLSFYGGLMERDFPDYNPNAEESED